MFGKWLTDQLSGIAKIVQGDREPVPERDERDIQESLERKMRSIATLQVQGVPCIENLPVIEAESEIVVRSNREVIERAVALNLVASRGAGVSVEEVNRVVDVLNCGNWFTPAELTFMEKSDPDEWERAPFSWRIEGYNTLLWSIRLVEDLGTPDICVRGVKGAEEIAEAGIDTFFCDADIRPPGELLDAADLIYRYHWAVRDALLRGDSPPSDLDPGVVAERHHALNWLIGYNDSSPWDDVTTDT